MVINPGFEYCSMLPNTLHNVSSTKPFFHSVWYTECLHTISASLMNTIKERSIDDHQANRANSNRASSKEKIVVEVYI